MENSNFLRVNKQLTRHGSLAFVGLCGFLGLTPKAQAVTWYQQAERLQMVSAALLDAFPVHDPYDGRLSLGLGTVVSMLPKVNPRVGGKNEKVPASPVHAVPMLKLSSGMFSNAALRLNQRLWVGYLPSGGEKLFGLKAKVNQSLFGISLDAQKQFGPIAGFAGFIFQQGSADVTGAITSSEAHDKFNAQTQLILVSAGALHPTTGVWGSVLTGYRKSNSKFEIPSDSTRYSFEDRSTDQSVPFPMQFTVGWRHASGIVVSLSELYVPERVLMPRLGLSYNYEFLASSSSKSSRASSGSAKPSQAGTAPADSSNAQSASSATPAKGKAQDLKKGEPQQKSEPLKTGEAVQ